MQLRDTWRVAPGSGRILIVDMVVTMRWRCAGTLPTTGQEDMERDTGFWPNIDRDEVEVCWDTSYSW